MLLPKLLLKRHKHRGMTHARLREINLFPEKFVLAHNFLIFQENHIE